MGRPPTPLISRRRVVDVALDIIDTQGLGALSIRAIAGQLGVTGASLYNHFANKREIELAVIRRILGAVASRESAGESWEDWMVKSMKQTRRAMLEHPNAVPLVLGANLRQLFPEVYLHGVEVLRQQGLPPATILTIVDATEQLVAGAVLTGLRTHRNVADDPIVRAVDGDRSSAQSDDRRFDAAARALVAGLSSTVVRKGWSGVAARDKSSQGRRRKQTINQRAR